MMGGIRLAIPSPVPPGLNIMLTLSEELVEAGGKQVLYPMRTGNHYRNVWVTGSGLGTPLRSSDSGSGNVNSSTMVFEHHEYMLFRYGELLITDQPVSPLQTATCAKVAENDSVALHCESVSDGVVISSIEFASYGTPTGACGFSKGDTFKTDSKCDAPDSKAVVEKLCLNQQACVVKASDLIFNVNGTAGSCGGVPKFLAVSAVCKHGATTTAAVTTASSSSDASVGVSLPGLKLSAWRVRYPWSESDSHFESSNTALNAVWKLCRDTLRITSLDTTTDSNTRERLPYEVCRGWTNLLLLLFFF
jgi:hypothetical protein